MRLVVLLSLLVSSNAINDRLTEVYSWKQLDVEYPSPEARQVAIDRQEFIPGNNLPSGLEISGERMFLTVTRWSTGVPSTLNYIWLNETQQDKSPTMKPYPGWEANTLPADNVKNKSSHIISALRLRADGCNRLWIMDLGIDDLLGSHYQITPPKIMVYDMKTDTLIRTYMISDDYIRDKSLFVNIVVESSSDDCEVAYAYIPDQGSYSLIVYSWKDNDSWRITHNFFYPDPLQGNFNIAGYNFQWSDGIFGLSLSPKHEDGYRTLYFHSISSSTEFSVSTQVLQNRNLARDSSDSYYEYTVLGSHGNNSQSTSSFVDEKTGVMFFGQINKNSVGCWNTNKPFNEETQGVVAQDDTVLVYVNDLKTYDDYLWVLSDKLPVYFYGSLDHNETNFRIFRATVSDAIRETVCQ